MSKNWFHGNLLLQISTQRILNTTDVGRIRTNIVQYEPTFTSPPIYVYSPSYKCSKGQLPLKPNKSYIVYNSEFELFCPPKYEPTIMDGTIIIPRLFVLSAVQMRFFRRW